MGSDKYRLNWKEFEDNTKSYFRQLRVNEEHSDLSLACEDGQQFDVHKLVLSACSPFFQMMLRRNPHQHPLIYMRGIKSSDLASILDFIYFGEIEMSQDELPDFLAVAEELKLKGLTPDRSTGAMMTNNPGFLTPPPGKRKRKSSGSSSKPPQVLGTPEQFVCEPMADYSTMSRSLVEIDDDEEVPVSPPHHEPMVGHMDPAESLTERQSESFNESLKLDTSFDPEDARQAVIALEEKIQSMITKQADGSWVCRVCGKTIVGRQARGNMKQHVETHIEGIQHTCTTCGKTYKNRNSLHTHISMKHRDSLNEVGKKKFLMCTTQISNA